MSTSGLAASLREDRQSWHHSGSLRVTLAVKSRSSQSHLFPSHTDCLALSQRSGMPKQAGIEWSFAFCPAPCSGVNQDSNFQGCLVSAALTSDSPSSLLPPCVKEHRVALPVSQLFLAFPGAVLACPFPLPAVHTDVLAADATCRHCCSDSLAWLYFPHCPELWLFGFFSSQGCWYKWICYYYKSAVFKRYCPKPKQHQCNLLNLPWSTDVGGVRTANN